MTERLLPVPDGLEGERIDIALTRMMGLSRTKTAELIDMGGVSVDGRLVNKGQRLAAGQVIGVNMSALDRPPARVIVAEPIPGMRILFDDDDPRRK